MSISKTPLGAWQQIVRCRFESKPNNLQVLNKNFDFPILIQKYYAPGVPRAYVSCARIAQAFKASPEGLKRAAELAEPPKPSDLDVARLATDK